MTRFVKRIADVTVAGLLLLLSAPIVGLAALINLLADGPPAFFSQERVGRDGSIFRVWKLRSMRTHNHAAEFVGQVTDSHPLVTPWGRLLRRSKVDELPQLISVVTGKMSLIGPRPTIPEQVARYSDWEMRRLEVRPGLSGWAQVNGNIALTWSERIALDIWYVDHWSLKLDARILFRTLRTVLLGESANRHAVKEASLHAKRDHRGR